MSDPEIEAISTIVKALDGLDEEQKQRALDYANGRYGTFAPQENRSTASVPEALPGTGTDSEGNGLDHPLTLEEIPKSYKHFGELFATANPTSNSEKALVAAYWVQIYCGNDTWKADLLNKELRNLGHSLSNVTKSLSGSMKTRPYSVIQVAKSGTSKQGRKRYKMTEAGRSVVESMLLGGGR